MGDDQVLRLLSSLGVTGLTRDSRSGSLTMVVNSPEGTQELPVLDLKKRHVSALRELEEQRREVLENRFAAPLTAEVTALGGEKIPVNYWKSDRQLTHEEMESKKELLRALEQQVWHHQTVIAGMNYLQVHAREMMARLAVSSGKLVRRQGNRIVWTRGIKSAALYCLQQMERVGLSEQEACSRFLTEYVIKGEEGYTPERLLNNVRQIRQLDRTR